MRIQDVNILIVDDVNAIRVQIRELLKNVGFERVILSSNGLEARNFLQEDDIHLILCDWHMQPMDGLELLKYCRTSKKYQDVGFIMVTAESTKELVVQAVTHGTDDYMVKPLTVEGIQTKVMAVLLKKRIVS